MGGLWVDYNLETTVPGLYSIGEANFSDHGANRLGASALMQGLADGYFVLPYTIGDWLAPLLGTAPVPTTDHAAFRAAEAACDERYRGYLDIGGHPLGRLVPPRARQDHVGPLRHGAQHAPAWRRRSARSPRCTRSSSKDVRVLGDDATLNQSLERAGRVDDFFELGQLMCRDALQREESCGGHFRAEHQTEEGEALRDDDELRLRRRLGARRRRRQPARSTRSRSMFENVKLTQRSYK